MTLIKDLKDFITPILRDIAKTNPKISVSEMLFEIGKRLNDENSILYNASKHNIPIFCPAITDGSIGFQLYFAKQKVPEFNLDVIDDFKKIMFITSQDDKKGIIALGGGASKHFAILSTIISGGMDYAVYITTARETSGSMSGATTNEAKSWGKVKDDADSVTVNGDASILFPLLMFSVLDKLKKRII
jgi:deoxyhypusine synthase